MSLFPGIFALIAVAAVNAVGNALRERDSTEVVVAASDRVHG